MPDIPAGLPLLDTVNDAQTARAFDRLYDGEHLAAVKRHYDPDDRFLSLYDKAVRKQ